MGCAAVCQMGRQQSNEIFRAVGLALTNWELLEHEMGALFVVLVAPRSNEAMRAYSAVLASGARLKMIGGAAEAFFLTREEDPFPALKKQVDGLLEAVEGFAPRRNEIAHGVIGIKFADEPMYEHVVPKSSWVLTPSIYAKTKRTMVHAKLSGIVGLIPLYEYSSVEINGISAKFRDLKGVASKVALAIRRQRHLERKALLEKSP